MAEAGSEKVRQQKARPQKVRSEKIAIFRVLAALIIPFMNLVGRYRIQQGEHLPPTGPVIVAPNHYSEIDPLVIGLTIWKLGRAPRYLGKASLFTIPVFGALLRKSGQIPVERAGSRGSDPLAAANQLVKDNSVVVVYPEGTLTRDPGLWPMR
ncbi:MAG TPA: lysophospholipid acyltransferase family protein, partial [Terrimesophilobacter sp.]|nr:lysophospholipid acyltransferase family protein [Terrimesophilobacter sp.]